MESEFTPFGSSTIQDRLGLVPSLAFEHVFRAGGGDKSVDYAILSVAVATLALILVVELVRHKLDVIAVGRPFYKTVLEGVYGELATLGIVESFIFLLHKYDKNLNISQELVFADVHFTLFFTAIFNAFMSVFLAFFATRLSNRLWVQTEYQDLHHYVEIREEFDRVDRKLLSVANRDDKPHLPSFQDQETSEHLETNNNSNRGAAAAREGSTRVATNAEREFQFNRDSVRELCEDVSLFFRAPVLYRQHRNLLVQVRFHELKYQFIHAHNLPITMHVSTYLKQSELHILQKLVHISTFAWLLLTAGLNFLYYLMGMVISWTDGDNGAVGNALTIIFFLSICSFVIMSFLLWNKMTWIFRQIIEGKLISSQNPESIENITVPRRNSDALTTASNAFFLDQKSLFWGKSPRLIIILIQFMQFGFSVALAVLLIYWKKIDKEGAAVPAKFFLLSVSVCYIIFVYCMANVLPRYTLCSSLGQLVNHERLHETLAKHRLEEAQRKRQQLQAEKESGRYIEWEDDSESDSESNSTATPALKALKSLGKSVRDFATNEKSKQKPIAPEMKDNAAMFAELVRTHTTELRSQLPEEAKLGLEERENERERRIQARRSRRKSLSDGVEAMRSFAALSWTGSSRSLNTTSSHDSESRSKAPGTTEGRPRGRSRKSMSASGDIQMMRDSLANELKVSTGFDRRPVGMKLSSSSGDLRGMREATILEEEPQHQQDPSSASKPDRRYSDITAHQASQKRLEDLLGEQGIDSKKSRRSNEDTERSHDGSTALSMVPPTENNVDANADHKDTTPPPPQTYLPRTIFHPDPITRPSSITVQRKSWNRSSLGQSESSSDLDDLFEEEIQYKMAKRRQQLRSNTDEMTTMRTDDDGSSETGSDNVDALEAVEQGETVKRKKKPEKKRSLYDMTRSYFRSRQYTITSAVFGTMICFYLVGMRIEGLLLDTGVLKDLKNTWEFETEVSFWLELCWLVCFLIADLMILFIFRPSRCFDRRDQRAFAAALIDVGINSTCLALLIVAEVFRCCDDPDAVRGLAATDKNTGYIAEKMIEIECCPSFGKRLYGGVGPIEPFTALVALRVFRFWMGDYISPKLKGFFGWAGSIRSRLSFHSVITDDNAESVRNPIDPLYDLKHGKRKLPKSEHHHHHDDHHCGDFCEERGSIVELWKTALTKFPDIISQHGEFSGELLQAMLGMEISELSHQQKREGNEEYDSFFGGESIEPLPTVSESQDEAISKGYGSEAATRPKRSNRRSSIQRNNTPTTVEVSNNNPRHQRLSTRQSIKMIGNEFTGLPAETQSIILAGKVGKTVHTSTSRRGSINKGLPAWLNVEGNPGPSLGDNNFEGSSPIASKSPDSGFVVIDDNDDLVDEAEAEGHDFIAPNARLLHSMRRCDKKLLPYVSKWTMVDVVMTKYEIVYFDATEPIGTADNSNVDAAQGPKQKQKQQRMQTIKSAIEATKGGKGLLLKDVAYGRRVVGRLELSSVEAVHVERILPHEGGNLSQPQGDEPNNSKGIPVEYWKSSNPKATADSSREVRWSKVKEDHLKVETKHDTLYLRFYGDLDNCEHHLDRMMKESEIEGALFKNNAFQWCQTIARIVGADGLNQAVEHIGSDDENDELREYLVIVDPKNAAGGKAGFGFRKTSRRGSVK